MQGPRSELIVAVARHSDQSPFGRMRVLVVAPSGPDQQPAIVLKHPKDLANLHSERIGALYSEVNVG